MGVRQVDTSPSGTRRQAIIAGVGGVLLANVCAAAVYYFLPHVVTWTNLVLLGAVIATTLGLLVVHMACKLPK